MNDLYDVTLHFILIFFFWGDEGPIKETPQKEESGASDALSGI